MTDSWHVLGDYLGACLVVAAFVYAGHCRNELAKRDERIAELERELDRRLEPGEGES